MADTKIEAEDAPNSKCDIVADPQYSGGKALRLTEANARINFSFDAPERAKYSIRVAGNGIGGEKTINCTVNGSTGAFKLNEYTEVEVGSFIMNSGTNKIVISPSWTWFDIDYIRIVKSDSGSQSFSIATVPVDAEATESARKMYGFLLNNFGTHTISGMMTGDMASANGNVTQHADIVAVQKVSGKTPALVGFDFMNATGKEETNSYYVSYTRSSVELALDTYRRGGLPAFTWHWRDPSRSTNEFYTDKSTIRFTKALLADGSWDTSSKLYQQIVTDIHTVADYFLKLQDEGVACIFRPLHEASGGWFWWGREGAEPFRKLFHLVYDEMVHVKGVHNIIWVWNAGPEDAAWNPGEEYYDVISADIYNNAYDYSSSYPTFDKLKALSGAHKIIALSENGPIPDIERQAEDDAMWSWWMPWYNTWNGNFVAKTSTAEWTKCMNDPRVITLEDLSDGWEKYSYMQPATTADGRVEMFFDVCGRRLSAPSKLTIVRHGDGTVTKVIR